MQFPNKLQMYVSCFQVSKRKKMTKRAQKDKIQVKSFRLNFINFGYFLLNTHQIVLLFYLDFVVCFCLLRIKLTYELN